MGFYRQTRLFLVLAIALFAMFLVGTVWDAPFHVDETGLTRLFGNVYEYAFIPVRMLLLLAGLAGIDPNRATVFVAVTVYLGVFIALDRVVLRMIHISASEAL